MKILNYLIKGIAILCLILGYKAGMKFKKAMKKELKKNGK